MRDALGRTMADVRLARQNARDAREKADNWTRHAAWLENYADNLQADLDALKPI